MKDCLIIGNKNAVTTKYVFPLLKDRVLKTGYTVPMDYTQPEWCETKSLNGLTRWLTTLPVTDKEPLVLTARYCPEKYPHYANYDAIEVSKISDIPMDYDGVMAVPISILDVYCPEQFDILGYTHNSENSKGAVSFYKPLSEEELALCKKKAGFRLWTPMVIKNGEAKIMYPRIFIRKRNA